MPPGNSFPRLVIGWGARWLTMMDSLFTELKQGCEKMCGGGRSISPGEAVRLSLLFFCCLCPCVFDFFMVCVFVFLVNSLFFSLSSVALSSACLWARFSVFTSLLFSVLAHISETITILDPSYFICFLWSDVTSKALLSFPALERNLIFDTLGYICDFTSDTADLCVRVDALSSVFFFSVWKNLRTVSVEIHVRVFVCGCLSPFSLSQVRCPLTQLGSPLTPKTSHMTLVLFQTV